MIRGIRPNLFRKGNKFDLVTLEIFHFQSDWCSEKSKLAKLMNIISQDRGATQIIFFKSSRSSFPSMRLNFRMGSFSLSKITFCHSWRNTAVNPAIPVDIL